MAVKELTHGNPYKLILAFMFPIFLGNVFQQFYNLVDGLIVGRIIGINALAAVGATTPFIFLVITFIYASTQGFTVVTAQKFGARDIINVKKSFAASIILSTILMLLITLLSTPFTEQLLKLLQTPDDILQMATTYLFIMFIGIFATVFYNLFSNVIRALGDSKTPLYFLIFSTIINIFLDLLFVIKFHWGIAGAGWATVTAQLISTIFCLWYMLWKFPLLRLKKEDWKLSSDFIYEHLRIGLPMGLQMSILSIGMIIVQYVLNALGSVAIASYTTAVRIDMMFSQIYLAIGATMAIYSAQNFGAKNMLRVRQGTRAAVVITVISTLMIILCINLFSEQMICWFMTEINPEIVNLAQEYLHIIVIYFIFLGLLMIYRNSLQGMGMVTAPLLSGIAELVARGGSALVFGSIYGYTGICYTSPLAWITGTIVLYIGYKIDLHKEIHKNQKLIN